MKNLFLIGFILLAISTFAQPCNQQVIASVSPTVACSGNPLYFSASAISGATYSWSGPANTTANTQNFTIASSDTTQSGDFIVTTTVGNCVYKDTISITVNETPKPVITGITSICSKGFNTGIYAFQFSCNPSVPSGIFSISYLNGANPYGPFTVGFTGSFNMPITSPSQSGWLRLQVNLNGCNAEDSLLLIIKPSLKPKAFIFASPDTNFIANTAVSFTGTDTNAGPTPTNYKWIVNNNVVSSGKAYNIPVFTSSVLQDGDRVCLWVKIDSTCASVDTAIKCVNLHVTAVHITGVESNKEFTIYPNPNSGKFYIDALDKETLEIRNTLGQVIYTHIIKEGKNEINTGNLAEGAYILSLRSGLEVRTSSLIIRH
jgi:hypothetical protein